MPTQRPRYQVTETDEVSHALDSAARIWPDEPRSRLLLRVLDAGDRALAAEAQTELAARRRAIVDVGGRWDAAFPPNYLLELRSDWPE